MTLEERSALLLRAAGSLIQGGFLFIGAHTVLVNAGSGRKLLMRARIGFFTEALAS